MTAIDPTRRDDLLQSLRLWRLWTFTGWQDIRQRYRGSVIGPFWIAGSVAVVTLGAGSLYAAMLKMPPRTLLPYISLSVSLWLFVSLTILEASQAFLISAPIVRNTPLPIGIHVLRVIYRNLVVLAHNLPVVVLTFLFFGYAPSPYTPLALVGFALLIVNISWIAWMAALLATRFRDLGQIIAFGLQFAIFVTPIFWRPEQAGSRHIALMLNPFHHMLAVVRDPIMGAPPSGDTWLFASVMALGGVILAIVAHRRSRHDVVFWL